MFKDCLQFLSLLLAIQSASSLAASTPSLMYFEKKGTVCAAKRMTFPEGKGKNLFERPHCPEDVFWNEETQTTYLVYPKEIEVLKAGSFQNPETKIALPTGEFGVFWIEASTGLPRYAYFVEVPERDISEGNFHYKGEIYNALKLPDWGISSVAIIEELKEGKWNTIEIQATKTQAGDVPGMGVLQAWNSRKIKGNSLVELIGKGRCGGSLRCDLDDPGIGERLSAQPDGFGAIEANGQLFAFPVVEGDTLHPSSPIFRCDKKEGASCKLWNKLETLHQGQLGLLAEAGYLLTEEEASGKKVRIFEIKTGKKAFDLPQAELAVWLPAGVTAFFK